MTCRGEFIEFFGKKQCRADTFNCFTRKIRHRRTAAQR